GSLGTHPAVGGTTGLFLNKYAAILLGTTYVPLGGSTVVTQNRPASDSRLYDINLTLEVQIPLQGKWAPYGLMSAGGLYNTYNLLTPRPDGSRYLAGEFDVKFGFGCGGGTRYFLGEDWGLKGEYRFVAADHSSSRLMVGIFYRVPSSWPFLARFRR